MTVHLSLRIFWPLLLAVLGGLAPRAVAPLFALVGALVPLGYAVILLVDYDAAAGGLQYLSADAWIEEMGIRYTLGVDGLNQRTTDRETIGNMGTETGATTSIFPSDERTREYLIAQGRGDAWAPLAADEGAGYDEYAEIDLAKVEPLIAKPSSPGNVVPVREVAGIKVDQVSVGSSVNSSFRDLMVTAKMLEGRRVHPETNFHVNPGSRQVLENVVQKGGLLAEDLHGDPGAVVVGQEDVAGPGPHEHRGEDRADHRHDRVEEHLGGLSVVGPIWTRQPEHRVLVVGRQARHARQQHAVVGPGELDVVGPRQHVERPVRVGVRQPDRRVVELRAAGRDLQHDLLDIGRQRVGEGEALRRLEAVDVPPEQERAGHELDQIREIAGGRQISNFITPEDLPLPRILVVDQRNRCTGYGH